MYKYPHHNQISSILSKINTGIFAETECYFGGGTAIVLLTEEYRESVDIDFMCSSKEGYKNLRNIVFNDGVKSLFTENITVDRSKADIYGIRAVLIDNGVPIKFEIVHEDRIELDRGITNPQLIETVTLTRNDMFAEKLLANADRHLDISTNSRDIIDLGMMQKHWGKIPDQAWLKAKTAYGDMVEKAYIKAVDLIRDETYLKKCYHHMKMDADKIPALMESLLPTQKASQAKTKSRGR